MRTTQQMSITLTNEMAEEVRRRVASGEYATESEVIRDGLRALAARERAVDAWLRESVVPAAEALETDPARAGRSRRPCDAGRTPRVTALSAARYRVVFAPEARDQLAELEAMIGVAGAPRTAAEHVDAIVTFCGQLEAFPSTARRATTSCPGCEWRTTVAGL
jgi:putative addiction module CopG family antidote